MIAEKIRNRVRHLMELRDRQELTGPAFDLAMAGFLADADSVERIEAAPVPETRRHCRDANVLDFVDARRKGDAA